MIKLTTIVNTDTIPVAKRGSRSQRAKVVEKYQFDLEIIIDGIAFLNEI